jgi:hypothetical protein
MSWHEPNNARTQKLRRRIQFLRADCAICVLVGAAPLVVLWVVAASPDSMGVFFLDAALILHVSAPSALMVLIGLTVLKRRIRVNETVLHEVPKQDGYLCPGCCTPLPEETPEGNCPKCRQPYVRAELPSYWVDYVFEPQRAAVRTAKTPLFRKLLTLQALIRVNPLAAIAFCTVLPFGFTLIMWWIIGLSFLRAVPLGLGMALVCAASLCVQRGRSRVGQTRHCVACDYQQSPTTRNPQCCPECGADWSAPGSVIIGAVQFRSHYRWLAGVLIGTAALLWLSHAADLTVRALPTANIIHDAVTSRSFTTAEWDELARRRLKPEHRLRLAVGLLDKRLRRNHLDITEGNWLWTQVSSGVLPECVNERYYREMLEVSINAPATARAGASFRVSLARTFRLSSPSVGVDVLVYFGGYFVGDDPIPIQRLPHGYYAALLGRADCPTLARITPVEPGPLRVRAVLYYAIGPGLAAAMRSAEWQEDGTIKLPAQTVWSHRIELEKTVDVRP